MAYFHYHDVAGSAVVADGETLDTGNNFFQAGCGFGIFYVQFDGKRFFWHFSDLSAYCTSFGISLQSPVGGSPPEGPLMTLLHTICAVIVFVGAPVTWVMVIVENATMGMGPPLAFGLLQSGQS
jgi:hypothetical protein